MVGRRNLIVVGFCYEYLTTTWTDPGTDSEAPQGGRQQGDKWQGAVKFGNVGGDALWTGLWPGGEGSGDGEVE